MRLLPAQAVLLGAVALHSRSTSAAVIDRFLRRHASPEAIESASSPGSNPPLQGPDVVVAESSFLDGEGKPAVTFVTVTTSKPLSSVTSITTPTTPTTSPTTTIATTSDPVSTTTTTALTTTSSPISSTSIISSSSSISISSISDIVTSDSCTPLYPGMTVTRYEITHSSTTTLTGDAPGYTAPFEPISTPEYCESTTAQPVPSSTFEASGTRPPPVHTVTFITTDKNPAVVWESEPPPPGYTTDQGDSNDGGGDNGGGNTNPGNDHKPPEPTAAPPPPPPSGADGSKPGFTITAKPSEVIINDSTVGGLRPGQTTTVVVDGGTFTIGPTAVVGQGTTVQRPAPAPGPTSAELGGVPVRASGSVVVVGGSTITVPAQGTAAYVGGKDVYAGPGTLIVDDETLTWSVADAPRQTDASNDVDDEDASDNVDIIVAGGEMITALGQSVVVVHSTTITYGPGGSGGGDGITTVIGTDTIVIDENGVSLRGSTLGGPSALPAATTREIVGGVTVTRLGPSLVVVGGRTYTVGQGGTRAAGATTTATVGDEAVTAGPQDVRVAGMTFGAPPPDEDAVVATIRPEATASGDAPTETGSGDGGPEDGDDEEDAAFSARPGIAVIASGLGLIFGAWAFM